MIAAGVGPAVVAVLGWWAGLERMTVMVLETIDILVDRKPMIFLLVIAETKNDSTFPTSQFMIEAFMKPFRYDRNQNGGGLLICVRERAPVKELTNIELLTILNVE